MVPVSGDFFSSLLKNVQKPGWDALSGTTVSTTTMHDESAAHRSRSRRPSPCHTSTPWLLATPSDANSGRDKMSHADATRASASLRPFGLRCSARIGGFPMARRVPPRLGLVRRRTCNAQHGSLAVLLSRCALLLAIPLNSESALSTVPRRFAVRPMHATRMPHAAQCCPHSMCTDATGTPPPPLLKWMSGARTSLFLMTSMPIFTVSKCVTGETVWCTCSHYVLAVDQYTSLESLSDHVSHRYGDVRSML